MQNTGAFVATNKKLIGANQGIASIPIDIGMIFGHLLIKQKVRQNFI
jgi:hypothetical protein